MKRLPSLVAAILLVTSLSGASAWAASSSDNSDSSSAKSQSAAQSRPVTQVQKVVQEQGITNIRGGTAKSAEELLAISRARGATGSGAGGRNADDRLSPTRKKEPGPTSEAFNAHARGESLGGGSGGGEDGGSDDGSEAPPSHDLKPPRGPKDPGF